MYQCGSRSNADLYSIAIWLNHNKLTLNVDKTKTMLIGSDSKLRKLNSPSVSVLDNQLDSVGSFKYLGVVLSSNFTWTEHVEHVISKVNQRLGLLRRIKHLLPYNARLLYYNSLVLPILDYADLVWGDKDNAVLMNNLQVLQNKAAKLVLNKPLYSSATDALSQLGWLNLNQRRHFHPCLYEVGVRGYENRKTAQKYTKKPQTASDFFPEYRNLTYMEATM